MLKGVKYKINVFINNTSLCRGKTYHGVSQWNLVHSEYIRVYSAKDKGGTWYDVVIY